MSDESLLNTGGEAPADQTPPAEGGATETLLNDDLSWVPDKSYLVEAEDGKPDFKTMAQKAIKRHQDAEALLKKKGLDVPKKPEEYVRDGLPEGFEVPEEMWKAFHDAGMTNAQAQQQIKYLAEAFLPAITEQRMQIELRDLQSRWGFEDASEEEFSVERAKVSRYAIEKFGEDNAAQIASTAKGMDALRKMMKAEQKDQSVHLFDSAQETAPKSKLDRFDDVMAEARKVRATDPIRARELEEAAYKLFA